jgi:glutathione S-transferase
MKLLYAPPSPYARKARVTVFEKALQEQVEQILVNPMNDDPELLSRNPLSKIPVLELADGTCLIDSAQICEYLDGLSTVNPLYGNGASRQQILQPSYLANGMLDAAVSARMELFRPAEMQWQPWVDRQRAAITRGLVQLESMAESFDNQITTAQITTGAMLEYLDFRHHDMSWRSNHPALASWQAGFAQRDSMKQTQPPAS